MHGSVIRVSSHSDYGILQNDKYGEIFFHRSQCDFQIGNLLVGKKLKFNLVSKKRLEAVNIELIVENSSSPFDILDLYKISDNSDNVSDVSDVSDNSYESCLSDHENEDKDMISYKEDNLDKEDKDMISYKEDNLDKDMISYKEDNLDKIEKSRVIWYMNFNPNNNKQSISGWYNMIDNSFVCTWQKPKVNQKLFEKLKVGDIIAWYVVGRGYGAILRVLGDCEYITDSDLKIWHSDEEGRKGHRDWEKSSGCRIIKIPVEFLSVTKLDNCIRRIKGWNTDEWTSGFRGPNAILPKHDKWKEQVIEMYKEMKLKDK